MARKIGEHYEGDVRVTWHEEGDAITIQRSQDAEKTIDLVAAINAEGAPTIDGLGKPVAEIPVTVAMDYCARRGIPWEKFLYTNEYDGEFRAMVAEYRKLAYRAAKQVHTIQ